MATKVKLIADGVITPDQITLTTASTGTNTTAPATTAFVQQEISALVDSSPDALNTLNELAAALGDDANFSTTVTNNIATKLPLAGGSLTGALDITAGGNQLTLSRSGFDNILFGTGTVNGQAGFHITNTTDSVVPFSMHENAPAATLVINSTGDVGIGTNSPTNYTGYTNLALNNATNGGLISFENNGTVKGQIYNSDAQFRLESGASTPIVFSSSTGEKMRMDSDGNLGIGTTSPSSSLTTQADSGIKISDSSALRHLNLTPALAGGDPAIVESTSANGLRIDASGSGAMMQFHTNSAERMRIDSSGNVGIGGTPNIGSSSGVGILTLKNSGTNRAIFEMEMATATSSGVYAQKAYYNGSGALTTLEQHTGDGATDSGLIKWFTTPTGGATTERMRIDSSGNVGIGTSSPGQLLDVDGTARFGTSTYRLTIDGSSDGVFIKSGTTGDDDSLASFGTYGSAFQFDTTQANGFLFKHSGNQKMRIDGLGNVDINTGRLKIINSGADAYFLEGVRDGGNTTLRMYDNNNNLYIDSYTNMSLRCNQTGGGSGGHIYLSGGNVGIGVSGAPTDKLHVVGTSLFAGNTYIGTSSSLYIPTNAFIKTYSGGTQYDALYHTTSINTNIPMVRIGNEGRGYSAILSGSDVRTPSPADFQDGGIQCTFTSYNLNNTPNYADAIILSTYTDSSGGQSNAFLISKAGNDIKVSRQNYNSTSTYSSGSIYTVDVTSASDERVKENVQNITNALELIVQLRPVTFEWTDDYILAGASKNANETIWNEETESLNIPETKTTNVGLIAQEVESIIPTVVHEDRISIPGVEGALKNINYEKLIPHLTKAIQELNTKLEAAEARITELEG